MKPSIFAFTAGLLFSAITLIKAQTYSHEDFAVPGDEFVLSNSSVTGSGAFNFDESGGGVLWDFSTLNILSQNKITYNGTESSSYKTTFLSSCVAACVAGGSSLPSCTSGCNSQWSTLTSLSRNDLDSISISTLEITDVSSFYKNSETGLRQNMIGFSVEIGGIPIKIITTYDSPDLIFPFPLQLNKVDGSSSHYTIDLTSLGVNFIYKSYTDREHYAEGTGTIVTPYQTFVNAIKLKTTTTKVDTLLVNGTSIVIPYPTSVKYSWFDATQRIPVLEVSGEVYGSEVIYSDISFLDEIRCLQPAALFAYTPLVGFLNENDSINVDFNNLSTNSDTFTWSFDDPVSGADNTSAALYPSHWFTQAGTYKVTLSACNSICNPLLCSAITIPVQVLDSAQTVAQFSYEPAQPCAGASIEFSNQSLNYTSSFWDFGDGGTTSEDSPEHLYNEPGTYVVKLIAKNSSASDTTAADVVISALPLANITIDKSMLCPGDTAILAAVEDDSYSYFWEELTGAGTQSGCSQCAYTQIIPEYSTSFKLTIYNDCGVSYDTLSITLQDSTQADFTFETSGAEVNFSQTSQHAVGWHWDFGDGHISTDQNPVHLYELGGNFPVILEATGLCNTDTTQRIISILITALDNDKYCSPFTLSPNPFKDYITIQGFQGQPKYVDVSIVTMMGVEVFELKNAMINQEDNTLYLSLPDKIIHQQGVLLLLLSVDGIQYVSKIIPAR